MHLLVRGARHGSRTLPSLSVPAAACAVAILVGGAMPSRARAYSLGVAGSLAKFRADAAPPALPSNAAMSAARNEFESFQIVLTGPASGAGPVVPGVAQAYQET